MSLFHCFLAFATVLSSFARAEEDDIAALGCQKRDIRFPNWQYEDKNVLQCLDHVPGISVPMRVLFRKCNLIGEADFDDFVPGRKMMVSVDIWYYLHDDGWKPLPSCMFRAPQAPLHYSVRFDSGKFYMSAENAAWKLEPEVWLSMGDHIRMDFLRWGCWDSWNGLHRLLWQGKDI